MAKDEWMRSPQDPVHSGELLLPYGLGVHNRTRAKAETLEEHGAEVADSPREVAKTSGPLVPHRRRRGSGRVSGPIRIGTW